MKIFEMSDWKECKDLERGLEVGQTVAQEVIDKLFESIPPMVYKGYYFQPGEEADFKKGKSLYKTFIRENGKWVYKGLHPASTQ